MLLAPSRPLAPSFRSLQRHDQRLRSADRVPAHQRTHTRERAPVDTLTLLNLATSPSVELIDVVVSAGWDFPDRGAGKGQRLLDPVAWDEGLVKWCLEHRPKSPKGPKTRMGSNTHRSRSASPYLAPHPASSFSSRTTCASAAGRCTRQRRARPPVMLPIS